MTEESLELRIKKLIVDALMLDDVTPEEIVDEDPLFVEGLGLDSIDAPNWPWRFTRNSA